MALNAVIGALRVNLGLNSAAFTKGLTKSQADLRTFSRDINRIGKNIQRLGTRLSVGLTLPLIALGKRSVDAAAKQEKAIAEVEAALSSMGNQAGFTSKQLQDMASSLQGNSLFGDEDILSNVTANLLTFGNLAEDTFSRAQVAVLDMSTALKQDLKSASITVGKALNDPILGLTALGRGGTQFSEVQKELIKDFVKMGDVASAQGIILKELEKQYGGQAKAAASLDSGRIEQAWMAIGDAMERVGAIILPVIAEMADKIKALAVSFQNLDPQIQRILVVSAGLAAALGPALIAVGLFVSAFATLNVPILAAVAGFGALAVAGGPLVKALGGIEEVLGRIASIAAVVAAWFGTKLVVALGLYAAAVARATLATLSLRTALIRSGLGAIIVVFGEAVFQAGKLSISMGGVGKAFVALGQTARDVFENRIVTGFKFVIAEFKLLVAGMKRNWALGMESLQLSFVDFLNSVTDAINASGLGQALGLQLSIADRNIVSDEATNAINALNAEMNDLIETSEKAKAVFKKPLPDRFGKSVEEAADDTGDLADSIDRTVTSIKEIDDAVGGGGGGGAAGAVESLADEFAGLADELSNAEREMKSFIDALLSGDLKSGLDGLIQRGSDAFGNIIFDAFKKGGGGVGSIFKDIGFNISSGLSQIKSVFSGGGLSAVFGAVSSFLPVIGAIGAIGSLVKGLFGSSKIIGQGFQLGFEDGGVIGGSFTTKKKKALFGLVSSTKTKTKAFDEATLAALNEQTTGIQNAVASIFESLGVTATESIIQGVDLAATRFDARGLSEEEVAEKFTEIFAEYGDALSNAIGGIGLDAAALLVAVNATLKPAGQLLFGTLQDMASAAEDLSGRLGGFDALSSSVASFIETFFTDAEKFQIKSDAVADVFGDLNIAIPKTNAAFKQLVLSQNLMTEAGREAYAALLQIAPTFDAITGAATNFGAFDFSEKRFDTALQEEIFQIAQARNYDLDQVRALGGDPLSDPNSPTFLLDRIADTLDRMEVLGIPERA